MTWTNQIVKFEKYGKTWYALVEVYTHDDGSLSWRDVDYHNPSIGWFDSPGDIIKDLERKLEDIKGTDILDIDQELKKWRDSQAKT